MSLARKLASATVLGLSVAILWGAAALGQGAGTNTTNGFNIGGPIGNGPVNGDCIFVNGMVIGQQACSAGGGGTVTSVSVVTANGVSGSVATATTTPAITITLGAITPSSVAIGAGSAITSSGPGGVLGSNAFNSTAFAPLASPTFTGTVTMPDSATWVSGGIAALTALGLTNMAAITWTGRGILTSPATGTVQHGAADVNGAPVAQIITHQNALAGSATNQAGANVTYIASLGTGTANNTGFVFQTGVKTTTGTAQATATTIMTILGESSATGGVQLAAGFPLRWTSVARISSNADGIVTFGNSAFSSNFTVSSLVNGTAGFGGPIAATLASATGTNVVCNTPGTTTALTVQIFATGCAASSARFKEAIVPLTSEAALADVLQFRAVSFRYRPEYNMGDDLHVGFTAEQIADIDPRWVTYEDDGVTPHAVKYNEMAPLFTAAIQQLKTEVDDLRRSIAK